MKIDLDSPKCKAASERSLEAYFVTCTVILIGHLLATACWAILAATMLVFGGYWLLLSNHNTPDRAFIGLLIICGVSACGVWIAGQYELVLAAIFLPLAVAAFFFFTTYWLMPERNT